MPPQSPSRVKAHLTGGGISDSLAMLAEVDQVYAELMRLVGLHGITAEYRYREDMPSVVIAVFAGGIRRQSANAHREFCNAGAEFLGRDARRLGSDGDDFLARQQWHAKYR